MKFVMFLGIYIEMKNHFRIQKNLDKSRFLISNYYSPTYDKFEYILVLISTFKYAFSLILSFYLLAIFIYNIT